MYDRNHDMKDEDYEDTAMEIFKKGLIKMLPVLAFSAGFILLACMNN